MNDRSQFLIQSIRGPVILITVGVLFAIDKFTNYGFGQTFPVLLIVIGILQLVGGRRRRADYVPPPSVPPASSASYRPQQAYTPSQPTGAPAPPPAEPTVPEAAEDKSGEAHS